jgi:hypothetical protein
MRAEPIEKRFWGKVNKADNTDSCWIWLGAKIPDGYGQISATAAHRLSWQIQNGEVPQELELDHLCRVRHCVNPWHLEPVTTRENILRGQGLAAQNARKTHCNKGHEFNENNTRIWDNKRFCRSCERERSRIRVLNGTHH